MKVNTITPVIVFRHNYEKLAHSEFTTIRGKSQFTKLKIGQEVQIETPKERFRAAIMALELRRVQSMALDFLEADTNYPGFRINSYQDFVRLLNSFRAPAWQQVTLESELTVITLRRNEPKENR